MHACLHVGVAHAVPRDSPGFVCGGASGRDGGHPGAAQAGSTAGARTIMECFPFGEEWLAAGGDQNYTLYSWMGAAGWREDKMAGLVRCCWAAACGEKGLAVLWMPCREVGSRKQQLSTRDVQYNEPCTPSKFNFTCISLCLKIAVYQTFTVIDAIQPAKSS
eukprot:1160252-Pelagomonas_calceolata.AAC.8